MVTKKHARVVETYLAKFRELIDKSHDDAEILHGEADELLLGALRELGFGSLADMYEEADQSCGGFWYA